MSRCRVALFIGRFQPFHKGHLFALRKALEVCEQVIIGIGSSEKKGTKDNPWDIEIRRKMVEVEIRGEGLKERVRGVWAVPDFPSDEEWVKGVELMINGLGLNKEEVTAVGNNEWTNRVLRQAGMKIIEPGFGNREEWEGNKIRALWRMGKEEWRERVSERVGKIIEK